MLLAVDIGNTNITFGLFENNDLHSTWRIATDPRKTSDEYNTILESLLTIRKLSANQITEVAICNVVPPLASVFEQLSRTYFQTTPLVVESGIKTGVRILYENPRDVGADRVVDAVAAYRLYGGPVIIVDFGTATVFDAVTKDGDYLGGAIAPGINIAADALFHNASQLKRVEFNVPKAAIGKNSITSLQSGLLFGYIDLVEGMVKRFKSELDPNAKVIATGGLAELFAKETNIFAAVNLDLTLLGLKMIYDLNR